MYVSSNGNSSYVFTTGKVIFTNHLSLGISPDLTVRGGPEGYSQIVYTPADEREQDRIGSNEIHLRLTPQEKMELADFAIDQWQRFKVVVEAEAARQRGGGPI